MSVQLSEAIIKLSEGQQPNLYSGSINSWTNRPKRPQMTSKVGQIIIPLANKTKTKEVGILLSKSTIKRILWIEKLTKAMGEKEKYGNVKKEIIIQSIPHYLSSMIETMLRQVWLPVDPGHECLLMM